MKQHLYNIAKLMRSKIWQLCIFMFVSQTYCIAQANVQTNAKKKENTISIGTGMSWLFEPRHPGFHHTPLNMPLLTFKHTFKEKYFVSLTAAKWCLFSDKQSPNAIIIYDFPTTTEDAPGKLSERINYAYIDLNIGMRIFNRNHHAISISAGPSFTWGQSFYYDQLIINTFPVAEYLYDGHTENKKYMGAIGKISYDYNHLWKDRLNLGAYFSDRYYPGLNGMQVDLGVQLGFNF